MASRQIHRTPKVVLADGRETDRKNEIFLRVRFALCIILKAP